MRHWPGALVASVRCRRCDAASYSRWFAVVLAAPAEFVQRADELCRHLRRKRDDLDDPDLGAVATLLDSGERSGDEVQDIAQDYGFKVCGSEGQ